MNELERKRKMCRLVIVESGLRLGRMRNGYVKKNQWVIWVLLLLLLLLLLASSLFHFLRLYVRIFRPRYLLLILINCSALPLLDWLKVLSPPPPNVSKCPSFLLFKKWDPCSRVYNGLEHAITHQCKSVQVLYKSLRCIYKPHQTKLHQIQIVRMLHWTVL